MKKALSILFLLSSTLWSQLPVDQIDITVNNVTGSDTGVSGAPAAYGPQSASSTCHTNGIDTNVIQWPSNPLSNVPIDGTAAIYINTDSTSFGYPGLRISAIISVTANTVSVFDTWNIPASSPVDCAVGGKWKTISTKQSGSILGCCFPDDPGQNLVIEYTGTDYPLSSTFSVSNSLVIDFGGPCVIRGTGPQRPRIVMSANAPAINIGACNISFLHILNISSTKTSAYGLDIPGPGNFPHPRGVFDSIFGGSNSSEGLTSCCKSTGTEGTNTLNFINNEIRYSTIGYDGPVRVSVIAGNYIHHNGIGIRGAACTTALGEGGLWWRNIVVNNSGDGIIPRCFCSNATFCGTYMNGGFPTAFNASPGGWYIENTIDRNGGNGFDFGDQSWGRSLINNQITNNGGYGIACTANTVGCEDIRAKGYVRWNNIWNNTLGNRNNWPVGEDETSVNPQYANPNGNDWCIPPSTSNLGGPPGNNAVIGFSLTKSLLVRGACQPQKGTYKYAY